MDYWYSHEISQQTIYNMDLILFTKLIMMHCELYSHVIGIEFHSLGTVYEYDLSNKEESYCTIDRRSHCSIINKLFGTLVVFLNYVFFFKNINERQFTQSAKGQ